MPSPLALIRGGVAGLATTFLLQVHADTDLWGHTLYGLDVLDSRAIPSIDPYSFTSDRPWINHEWLAELIMALFYKALGGIGLTFLVVAIGLCALAVAYWSLQRSGLSDWSIDGIAAAVFVTGIAPLAQSLRPQTFSVLLFLVLLATLREHDRGRPRALFVVPLVFLMWANLHGGWVLAAGVLAVWTVVRLIEARTIELNVRLVLIAAASAGATGITPYGFGLWRFLVESVRFTRPDIVEWSSVMSAPIMSIPWGLTVLVAVVAMLRSNRKHVAYTAICVLLAGASFRVIRLIPFFSLAVGMLLVPTLASTPATQRTRFHFGGWASTSVIWIVCVLFAATTQSTPVGCLPPIGAIGLDEQAAQFLRDNHVSGRLLVWFNWGEYVSWHFGSTLRVSMDGRRETVYSSSFLAAHNEFYSNGPGARAFVEHLAPDYAWLPRVLPITPEMSKWGWTIIYETPSSIVWTRTISSRPWQMPTPVAPACFPIA